jgi:hypothetical protein
MHHGVEPKSHSGASTTEKANTENFIGQSRLGHELGIDDVIHINPNTL